VHQKKLDDGSTKWAVGYKSITWNEIRPGGLQQTELTIAGDDYAGLYLHALGRAHGYFNAINEGGLEKAKGLERRP
jgi:hypothetical protein